MIKKYFSFSNLKTLGCIVVSILITCSCQKDCKESKLIDCSFPEYYSPVCGCNGTNYGNPEEAKCHGIENYTKGTCTDN